MPTGDRVPRVPQGPIGAYVISNLAQLRKERRLSYQELSARLTEVGRPIPALGLSRIEKGTRRVDADDLVGLALALGVAPNSLLLPRVLDPDTAIELTEKVDELARDAWAWAEGRWVLPAAGPGTRSTRDLLIATDFFAHARPAWAPLPEVLRGIADGTEED